MKTTRLFGAVLIFALLTPTGRVARATGSRADVVFEWNQMLHRTLPLPAGVGTPASMR